LRWEDLNHQDRTILIRDRKDPRRKLGNNQIVPLLGRSYAIVCAQPKAGELIFPLNGKSWSSIFPRACSELGIHDLNLYDLRHEGISRLVESGKNSIPEVMLVSGHKDPKQMTRHTAASQEPTSVRPRRARSTQLRSVPHDVTRRHTTMRA
jgi:integrase